MIFDSGLLFWATLYKHATTPFYQNRLVALQTTETQTLRCRGAFSRCPRCQNNIRRVLSM